MNFILDVSKYSGAFSAHHAGIPILIQSPILIRTPEPTYTPMQPQKNATVRRNPRASHAVLAIPSHPCHRKILDKKIISRTPSHACTYLSDEFRFGCTLSFCTRPLPAPLSLPCILASSSKLVRFAPSLSLSSPRSNSSTPRSTS
jgi:hypothetical protein